VKKATTLLVQYGFEIKKGYSLLVSGSGSGSIWFAYSNSKEYVENYATASSDFMENLKKDFLQKSPSLSAKNANGDINVTFTFFTCVHSLTEKFLNV
jgi:hypothetical protein